MASPSESAQHPGASNNPTSRNARRPICQGLQDMAWASLWLTLNLDPKP